MKTTLIRCLTLLSFWASTASALNLVLWEHEKDEDQAALDDYIKQFEAQNPKVTVKRSHYKTEDLRTQFQTAALGGGGPDMVIAPNDFAGPFSVMQIIKPVNGFFKSELFYDDVVASATDGSGQIWGLPLSNGNHLMLFYNKKLVPDAPKTVEDLIASAKKISNPDKKTYGFTYNLNEPFWFVTFLGAYGEKPLTSGKPSLETEGMVKALELVKKLKFEDRIVPPDCDYTCAEALFLEGRAGMTINGDWAVGKYQEKLKGDLGIAPLPTLQATAKPMVPLVSGKFLFLNAKLKGANLKEAKRFGEFLMSDAVQKSWVEKTGRLPALKSAGQSDVVQKNPGMAAALAAAKNGEPMPMAVEMRAVWDAIRPQLQKVMAGREEPKVAASMMQRDAEAKIKEMKQ